MATQRSKATKAMPDCWRRIGVWSTAVAKCEHLEQVIHCRNCQVFIDAGRSVFDRKWPADYREEWTRRLYDEQRREAKAAVGAVVFRIGGEWYALPAVSFDGVSPYRTIHRVPHLGTPLVAGVVNISGKVMLCYALDKALGITCRDDEAVGGKAFRRLMVIRLKDQAYVFPVDEVKGMYRYNPGAIEEPPSTLGEVARRVVAGLFTVDSLQVAALDAAALGDVLEAGF